MTKQKQAAVQPDVTPLRSDVLPRYRQVEAILRDQIWLGELGPGDQLPTEEELCRRFAVSRATVRQALKILEQENLIHKAVPRGTFVNPTLEQVRRGLIDVTRADLLDMRGFEIQAPRTGFYTARGDVQTALKVASGSKVFFFLRVFNLNGEPVGGEQVYLAADNEKLLSGDDMIAPSISKRISQRLNRLVARTDIRVSAITADARHAIRFDTFSGAPLISVTRTSYGSDGDPYEYGHTVLRCDRCQLILD